MNLKNKRIIIAVSGGIAAYKACELVRTCLKQGADVRVMMTQSATRFVTPLTFETLTNNEVMTQMFPEQFISTRHIDWADWADCIVLAPATANIIGKLAHGLSDDIVTTVLCAFPGPKVIAPAMNSNMWRNTIVQDNISKLEQHGYRVMGTSSGELACGWIGEGRLADQIDIIHYIYAALSTQRFQGKRILISSGPTIEDIDPVRFLSNRSSGKMGQALAFAAWALGAEVTMVTGPTHQENLTQVRTFTVRSAEEMHQQIKTEMPHHDVYISAAAIADYRPKKIATEKIKKGADATQLELEKTTDILSTVERKKEQLVIGFALETVNPERYAKQKLAAKSLDAIILNNPFDEGAGFEHDTNQVTMYFKDGRDILFEKQSKQELAFNILNTL